MKTFLASLFLFLLYGMVTCSVSNDREGKLLGLIPGNKDTRTRAEICYEDYGGKIVMGKCVKAHLNEITQEDTDVTAPSNVQRLRNFCIRRNADLWYPNFYHPKLYGHLRHECPEFFENDASLMLPILRRGNLIQNLRTGEMYNGNPYFQSSMITTGVNDCYFLTFTDATPLIADRLPCEIPIMTLCEYALPYDDDLLEISKPIKLW